MIRTLRYKISEDTKGIEPKTRQWAGMQYEDNATDIVFDLSKVFERVAISAARIDFNSAAAGYHPSENLDFGSGVIRRTIPKYITQYGGELQITAVVTLVDPTNEGKPSVCLSYPVEVYFTPVEKSENGNTDVEGNISEMENAVKEAETNTLALAAETKRLANETAILYENIVASDVTAEKLADTKREAEDLIYTVEKKLESGAFVGERGPVGETGPIGPQGPKGDKGEKGEDAVTDQSYNPESPNAQSGIAVAEALSNVGGGGTWEKIVDITITQERNGIDATTEEFPNLAKCNEFITRLILPKTETALTLGATRFYINDTHFFRVNSTGTLNSGLSEIRCHTIIADKLIYTVGNESVRGHANVVGNAYILVGNLFTDTPQEIRVFLNDTAKYLPIGTQFVIYGKVEG